MQGRKDDIGGSDRATKSHAGRNDDVVGEFSARSSWPRVDFHFGRGKGRSEKTTRVAVDRVIHEFWICLWRQRDYLDACTLLSYLIRGDHVLDDQRARSVGDEDSASVVGVAVVADQVVRHDGCLGARERYSAAEPVAS